MPILAWPRALDGGGTCAGQKNPRMSEFKGILFDFDGNIVDIMAGHFSSWKAALGDCDISIQAKGNFPLEGAGMN